MTNLELINGNLNKKIKPNKYEIYDRIFTRSLTKIANETKKFGNPSAQTLSQLILFGVKAFNLKNFDNLSYEDLIEEFSEANLIIRLVGGLTPKDMEAIFPIIKNYDGEKYGWKDYFYVKKYITSIGDDVLIEDPEEFLWEYWNKEIKCFQVRVLKIMSSIRRYQGGKSLAEEFIETMNEKSDKKIDTYTKVKRGKKELLINNRTGEETRVKKKIPRYLRAVKAD